MSETDGRTCANCRFWEAGVYEVEEPTPEADETETEESVVTAMDVGLCHRYPRFETRVASYWCGEWQPIWEVGRAYE